MATNNGYRDTRAVGVSKNASRVVLIASVDGRLVRAAVTIDSPDDDGPFDMDLQAREKVLAELISHWESLS